MPISLVDRLYKILSKLLAGRMKRVLGSLISSGQSTFMPGRQLLNGVLVANETLDFATSENKDCLLYKVNFEKTYDMASWEFLRFMLQRMGFGANWLIWMEILVFSSQMSVLVNRSPTKDFEVEMGLQKGNSLSPFLFVIFAEGMTCLVRKASELGEFKGFSFHDSCSVDLLQFADKTFIIGNGNWKNFWDSKVILRGF